MRGRFGNWTKWGDWTRDGNGIGRRLWREEVVDFDSVDGDGEGTEWSGSWVGSAAGVVNGGTDVLFVHREI